VTCGSVVKIQHIGTGYRSVSRTSIPFYIQLCSANSGSSAAAIASGENFRARYSHHFLPFSSSSSSSSSLPPSPSPFSSSSPPSSTSPPPPPPLPPILPPSLLLQVAFTRRQVGLGISTAVRYQAAPHPKPQFKRHRADVSPVPHAVTANQAMDDHNSLWIIRGGHGEHCPQGTPVRDGMKIRLTHHSTRQNLHSHLHSSPLSRFSRPDHPREPKSHPPYDRNRDVVSHRKSQYADRDHVSCR
jgi:hypothetical protein